MKSSTVQIRHEERIISRFCALRVSRYMLCILLFPLYFIHYPAALYPLAALLVLPPFLNLILETSRPQDNEAAQKQSSMPQIIEQYHFSFTGYRSERFCFILGLGLLAVWQWIQPDDYCYRYSIKKTLHE